VGEEEDVREDEVDEEDEEDAGDHNQPLQLQLQLQLLNRTISTALPQVIAPAPSQQFKPIKSFRDSSFLAS
jgi:hypothetical protein